MSWSSGGSSAPGFRRAAGRRGEESRSPVPYRENPMAYEPEKLCWCNPRRKAPRWISWSRQNPGRRYYACVDAMFWSDLIGDLRDEVRRLRGQGSAAVIEDPTAVVALPEAETGGMGIAMSLQDQLKQKNAEIHALKGKYQNAAMLFVVFVVGLVAGKMLL
ncbi:hypothetical protein VPH35_016500 [Triticum aestivum]